MHGTSDGFGKPSIPMSTIAGQIGVWVTESSSSLFFGYTRISTSSVWAGTGDVGGGSVTCAISQSVGFDAIISSWHTEMTGDVGVFGLNTRMLTTAAHDIVTSW